MRERLALSSDTMLFLEEEQAPMPRKSSLGKAKQRVHKTTAKSA
jgi:hypothetical protein